MAKCVISGVAPGGDTTGFAKIQTGSFSDSTIVLESIPNLLILTRPNNGSNMTAIIDFSSREGTCISSWGSGSVSFSRIKVNGKQVTVASPSDMFKGNYIAIG